MDNRSIEQYQTYRRIAGLVEQTPEFRALAAESQAFTLFVGVVDRLEALAHQGVADRLELADLRNRIDALKKRLRTELGCMDAAFVLARPTGLEAYRQPNEENVMRCVIASAAYVDLAERYRDVLVADGMHPRKIEDARQTIAELLALHHEWRDIDIRRSVHVQAVNYELEQARERKRQLKNELAPALAAPAQSQQWTAASTLGRTHRPPALAAPNTRLLSAPPTADTESSAPAPVHDARVEAHEDPVEAHDDRAPHADRTPGPPDHRPHERTIGGIFRSVVGRLSGDDGHAKEDDTSVEETGRLGSGPPPPPA